MLEPLEFFGWLSSSSLSSGGLTGIRRLELVSSPYLNRGGDNFRDSEGETFLPITFCGKNIFSLTFLIKPIWWGVADKVGLEVSVSALRVAVVGAEFEVGGEERAGMVASASEE